MEISFIHMQILVHLHVNKDGPPLCVVHNIYTPMNYLCSEAGNVLYCEIPSREGEMQIC